MPHEAQTGVGQDKAAVLIEAKENTLAVPSWFS
jgi:hypothetical protein